MTALSRHGAGRETDARGEHAPSRVPGHALVAGTSARPRAWSSDTTDTRSTHSTSQGPHALIVSPFSRRSAGFSPLQPHLQPTPHYSNNLNTITAPLCRPAAPSRRPRVDVKPDSHNAPNTKNNPRNLGNYASLIIGNFVTRNSLQINQQNTKKHKNTKNNIFFKRARNRIRTSHQQKHCSPGVKFIRNFAPRFLSS